jgi:hypothetical protein
LARREGLQAVPLLSGRLVPYFIYITPLDHEGQCIMFVCFPFARRFMNSYITLLLPLPPGKGQSAPQRGVKI